VGKRASPHASRTYVPRRPSGREGERVAYGHNGARSQQAGARLGMARAGKCSVGYGSISDRSCDTPSIDATRWSAYRTCHRPRHDQSITGLDHLVPGLVTRPAYTH